MSEGEGKLTEYEERYRSIFMESPIAITLYDSEGKLIDANKACLDIFGLSNVIEIKGIDLFNDPNVPKDALEKLKKGKIVKYEYTFDFEKVKSFFYSHFFSEKTKQQLKKEGKWRGDD